jgi:hypothetical protein
MSNVVVITSMPERRRPGLVLPADPSEEELARNWTLSEADRAEVWRCRGDDNRRRFSVQLCVLRQYGCFRSVSGRAGPGSESYKPSARTDAHGFATRSRARRD